MNRAYVCLIKQEEEYGDFKISPVLDKDQFAIMKWRNEQIDILRQNKPLTKQEQELYFKNVVEKLFLEQQPKQLLFGFYENGVLVGYGGLVHINWIDKNAEISFLTEVRRNKDVTIFKNDWSAYLKMIERIAFLQLNMVKIFTYSYDIRPALNDVLIDSEYICEARLKKHVCINKTYADVLIHSKFKDGITF